MSSGVGISTLLLLLGATISIGSCAVLDKISELDTGVQNEVQQ